MPLSAQCQCDSLESVENKTRTHETEILLVFIVYKLERYTTMMTIFNYFNRRPNSISGSPAA